MLAAGWRLVLEGSQVGTAYVPGGSLAANASCVLWGDGAWIIWRASELTNQLETRSPRVRRSAVDSSASDLDLLRQRVAQSDRRELSAMSASLTDLEMALVDVLATPLPTGAPTSPTVFAVAKELRLPPSAVSPLVSTVLTKLDTTSHSGGATQMRSST
jgi:hypothetical protein